jgi:hypothetical protein
MKTGRRESAEQQPDFEGGMMNSAILAPLMMLSVAAYGPINADDMAFNPQALTPVVSANQQGAATISPSLLTSVDVTTLPPSPTSKAPPVKVKHTGAKPCSKQTTDNHDAQIIPAGKKPQWPNPRPPSVQQKQCQPQKSAPNPPHIQR